MTTRFLGWLAAVAVLAACGDSSTAFTSGTGGSTSTGGGGSGNTGGSNTGGSHTGGSHTGGSNTGGSGGGTCGDGVLDPPGEECDDGGTVAGDGCDGSCQLEPVGQTCGDTLDAGEKCDDGNLLNGDGCNPTCNFLTQVTELAVGVPGSILTSDGTYLYLWGQGGNCQIHRAAIAQCAPGSCAFTPFVGVGGCAGAPADGPGATAVLGPGGGGLAFGAGKLFFGDGHTVRAVDLGSATLDVTTVAGDPNRCGQLDGVGGAAVMSDVRGLAYYGGLLYFVDANMATLRSVDPQSGQVTLLAGQTPNDNANTNYDCATNLCCGNTNPGAPMNSPRYIASDNSGSLFIVDTNGSAIRRYDIGSTTLSTIVSGVGYVDGVGAAVRMDRPRGITSDGTSLYFGEQDENTVRQIVVGTATTSTFVGVRGCAGPANLAGMSGGDGSQSWTGNCNAGAVAGKPQFAVGAISLSFDYGTKAIYAVATGNRLLRFE